MSDALDGPRLRGSRSREWSPERLAEAALSGRTREEYLEALEDSRSAKYDEEVSKLSPEDRSWGDPPDGLHYTEEEEFAMLYDMGMKPEEFADKGEGERYREWLTMLDSLRRSSQ